MSSHSTPFWLLIAALGMGMVVIGCDQVSRPDTGHPPSVSRLEITPDSVDAATVPPRRVQDSTARIPLQIAATATDPDGRVERVVFTIEPASNPRGTLSDTLSPAQRNQDGRYQRTIGLGIPVSRDAVYTIRVFAVDNDSLASNQSIGRFRFVGK